MLSRIAAHPEDFACLNMEEKAAALKTLMTEPSIKNSQARINQLPEDIFAEINNRMSAFAEQALASGKDVSETARKLGEIYNRLGAFPSGDANADNGFMTKISTCAAIKVTDAIARFRNLILCRLWQFCHFIAGTKLRASANLEVIPLSPSSD